MDTVVLVVIVVALVVVALLAFLALRQRRSQRLQEQFGPEYGRTLARTGDRRATETDLTAREKRRRDLDIVELEPAARDRYLGEWRAAQNRFVDDPAAATREADVLVAKVMRDRGYPVDDFDQRATDVSVDHPQVAENYRAAHAVSRANEKGLASTDDLRQAFVYYRSLFAELLDVEPNDRREAK
jgi:hypothetical protein